MQNVQVNPTRMGMQSLALCYILNVVGLNIATFIII